MSIDGLDKVTEPVRHHNWPFISYESESGSGFLKFIIYKLYFLVVAKHKCMCGLTFLTIYYVHLGLCSYNDTKTHERQNN